MTLTLCDDGTMDTVFQCSECEEEIRFDSMSEYRDEDGALRDEGLKFAEEVHAESTHQGRA